VATTTPLHELEMDPETKYDTDLVVSALGEGMRSISKEYTSELTISGSSPALSVSCMIV